MDAIEITKRNKEMSRLYARGYTMPELAARYDITKQRVQQILSERFGMGRRDGGMHARMKR